MPNPFAALLGKMFGGGKAGVLGIDIGSSAIKLAQIRKKGGAAVLETYGELSLGGYGGTSVGRAVQLPVETLSQALRDVLVESNVTTKDCAIAIPLSSSLVSFMEMPAVGQKQLAVMIPIEARKYIPVPISEISLDWWIIPEEPEKEDAPGEQEPSAPSAVGQLPATTLARHVPGTVPSPVSASAGTRPIPGVRDPALFKRMKKVDVLVVAIHNETLLRYRDIMRKVGLETHFLEIEIFSTVRAVLEQGIAPVMVFDMGAASTKLYMVEHGIVRDSHIISRGSQDITAALSRGLGVEMAKAEELKRTAGLNQTVAGQNISEVIPTSLDYVFAEANRVLLQYQRKHNTAVSRVVLSGGGVLLPGFLNIARSKFATDVVFADPFAKLETPAFLEEMLRQAGPGFAVAIGVALRRLQERG